MIIDKLYLQITRNCTLNCEHCLKGDKEHINMTSETLNNIFSDINGVNTLLLTGGEPLLNIDLINELVNIINRGNISIRTIGIVTNGTILTDKHIEVLSKLKKSCGDFKFFLSSDVFHRLEWDRLCLKDRIERNFERYRDTVGIEKFLEDDRFRNIILFKKGRARNISSQRIDQLKKDYYITLKLREDAEENDLSYIDNCIFGKICIDVHGNIVDYSVSYDEEDKCSNGEFNVNNYPFCNIIYDYIDSKDKGYQKTKKRY